MRWQIQGSDVVDGKPVMMDVEAESAVDAVAHAHDRKVVVGAVGRSGGKRLLKWTTRVAFAATIALGVSTLLLVRQLSNVRRAAAVSADESRRVVLDLQAAREAAEGRIAFLEGSLSDREKQREAAIREMTKRLADSDQALQGARSQAGSLDRSGKEAAARAAELDGKVAVLSKELAAIRKQHADLQTALKVEKVRTKKASDEISTATARAADAESKFAGASARLNDLAAQLKSAEQNAASLKAQLDHAKVATEPAPRYALAVSYDAAVDFATLHVGKPAFENGRDVTKVTAAEPVHANVFSMLTDRERIFQATLVVCLAEDAPKEVLADNQATLQKYVATFSPQWKGADTWLAGAFKQTSGKGESELSVLITDHYRISVWGNKSGQYGVRIEPKGAAE